MKHTTQTRKVIVKSVSIDHVLKDNPLFPKGAFYNTEVPLEVWLVRISFRDGMKPEQSTFKICDSQKEAQKIASTYQIGEEMRSIVEEVWETLGVEALRDAIDRRVFPMMGPDEDRYLVWKTLVDAEVIAPNGVYSSTKISDFLGRDRIDDLQKIHTDNWRVAAEFEYCWQNYHHSSPVFIAAACNFKYYIEGNEYAAGYLLRDLEILVHGVEAEALKAQETRRRAGGAGGATSRTARAKRRTDLFAKMETLSEQNPAFVRLGAEQVAKLALEDCQHANPALWRQGKGQVNDYLGEIRRGEAGDDMRARFQALFGTEPPKRSKG